MKSGCFPVFTKNTTESSKLTKKKTCKSRFIYYRQKNTNDFAIFCLQQIFNLNWVEIVS